MGMLAVATTAGRFFYRRWTQIHADEWPRRRCRFAAEAETQPQFGSSLPGDVASSSVSICGKSLCRLIDLPKGIGVGIRAAASLSRSWSIASAELRGSSSNRSVQRPSGRPGGSGKRLRESSRTARSRSVGWSAIRRRTMARPRGLGAVLRLRLARRQPGLYCRASARPTICGRLRGDP